MRREFSNPLAILMTLVGLVLVIACADLGEFVARPRFGSPPGNCGALAMGAGRMRVIRQLLTESLLLAQSEQQRAWSWRNGRRAYWSHF